MKKFNSAPSIMRPASAGCVTIKSNGMKGGFSAWILAVVLMASAVFSPVRVGATEAAVTLPQVLVEEERAGYGEADPQTATKTDTPVLETPQSVTTVTRAQLDDMNPQTVKEALNYTAGVLSAPDTTSRYDSVSLRGFGGFGTSTRIADFLDGLKLPRGQAFLLPSVDPFLLDSVSVLKGPSAVLYGQTSPGGLINQTSREPSPVPYNEVRGEIGSYDRIQGGVTSHGAMDAENHWQYSVTGIGRSSGTRYAGVDEERIGFSPAVTWEPSADTRLTLRSFYQYDPKGGYLNSIYPASLAPEAYRDALSRDLNVGDPAFDSYEREQFTFGYSLDHRFSKAVSITSKTRYALMDLDFQGIQMVSPLSWAGVLSRGAARSVEKVEGLASDTHARFDLDTGAVGHTALVGLDFQHSVSNWQYQYGYAPSLDVVNPVYGVSVGSLATYTDNEQTLQQTGVYVQEQLSFGGFRTLLGARYDWTEQETDNFLTDAASSQSSSSPSYRAGLLYGFANGLSPYVSYSTSFEPTVGVDENNRPFEPTEAKQWEIGLKYAPLAGDALFTISAFNIRQENVLTPAETAGYNVQQGEIRSRGLEFEARGKVWTNFELIFALTLLDTEITESTDTSAMGKRPQAVPEIYGSVWANYTFDSGFLDGLTLGAGVRRVGSSYADDANTVETDGYTLVDAAAAFNLGRLSSWLEGTEATLNLTNLFDVEYYSSGSYNYYCQYGNGTQAVLGLRHTW